VIGRRGGDCRRLFCLLCLVSRRILDAHITHGISLHHVHFAFRNDGHASTLQSGGDISKHNRAPVVHCLIPHSFSSSCSRIFYGHDAQVLTTTIHLNWPTQSGIHFASRVIYVRHVEQYQFYLSFCTYTLRPPRTSRASRFQQQHSSFRIMGIRFSKLKENGSRAVLQSGPNGSDNASSQE
jgi:hypothetical protein